MTDLSAFPITTRWPAQHPDRLQLYSLPTPNGVKVSIMLEEIGLAYEPHLIDIMANETWGPEYLSLNPNGKIPAILDPNGPNGQPLALFESGAILIYLAEQTGRLLPAEPKARMAALQWLMFQMGGIGPMMGQANVFYRYLPEKIPVAIDRYQNECRRLFEVLDRRLGEAEWLAGGEYSIADIASWCWVRSYKWSGVSIDGLDQLRRWMDTIRARPAAEKGIAVPFKLPEPGRDAKAAEAFATAARGIVQR